MTKSEMNLDELPPHTLVVENGRVTPIGRLILDKTAEDLIAVCRQAKDPQAALQALPGLIAKHMGEISSRRSNGTLGQPGSEQAMGVTA
ncbi:hypothetical protein ACFYVW_18610 [Streptomyces tendae]|uniref:hypothetical protein n=1 Tax=Streptomyces tendae TaxID=1932 RepID=UPI0036C881CE